MKLIILFIYLISYVIGMLLFFKNKNLLEVFPIGLISLIFLVYILMFFFSFSISVYISIFISFFIFVYTLFKIFKEKDNILKSKIVNYELLFIFGVYLFVTFISWNKGFGGWDDYSHWGIMIKETLRLDTFYSVGESTLTVHKDYAPFITIFESIWIKILNNYSEAYSIRAIQFISFSFIFSKIKLNKKNIIKIIIGIVITCSIEDLSYLFYNTIYLDPLVAITIGYCLYYSLTMDFEKDDIVIVSLAISFMLMIKQINMAFYLLSIFAIFINYFYLKKKRNILPILPIVITPIIFYLSWNIYVSNLDVSAQFVVSDIKIFSVFKDMFTDSKAGLASRNFIEALYKRSLYTSFNISYLVMVLLNSLILLIINKKDKIEHIIVYILGAIGYAFLMMLLYMYSFNDVEGINLASYVRYMSTYVLTGQLLIFYNLKIDKTIFISLVFVILGITSFRNLIPSLTDRKSTRLNSSH